MKMICFPIKVYTIPQTETWMKIVGALLMWIYAPIPSSFFDISVCYIFDEIVLEILQM